MSEARLNFWLKCSTAILAVFLAVWRADHKERVPPQVRRHRLTEPGRHNPGRRSNRRTACSPMAPVRGMFTGCWAPRRKEPFASRNAKFCEGKVAQAYDEIATDPPGRRGRSPYTSWFGKVRLRA